MSLRNFDLNLLVVLETLLTEGSVTRAARRLRLTQPAVSQALSRARELFGDPLLTREGAQMILTPKGVALIPQLREFCSNAERLLVPATFDPASARMDFKIMANDVSELLVLPPLITQVARQAPHCRLIIRSVEQQLIDHTTDIAIMGTTPPHGPFTTQTIYEDHFVLLARHHHPALRGNFTAEAFAALPQALVSPTGRRMTGPIDHKLETMGLERTVNLSITRFATLPQILASTDLIAAVPSRFAIRKEVQELCTFQPLPFESPRFAMRMVWHSTRDADPAHKWLRELIKVEGNHEIRSGPQYARRTTRPDPDQ